MTAGRKRGTVVQVHDPSSSADYYQHERDIAHSQWEPPTAAEGPLFVDIGQEATQVEDHTPPGARLEFADGTGAITERRYAGNNQVYKETTGDAIQTEAVPEPEVRGHGLVQPLLFCKPGDQIQAVTYDPAQLEDRVEVRKDGSLKHQGRWLQPA